VWQSGARAAGLAAAQPGDSTSLSHGIGLGEQRPGGGWRLSDWHSQVTQAEGQAASERARAPDSDLVATRPAADHRESMSRRRPCRGAAARHRRRGAGPGSGPGRRRSLIM
jgi:hypothetical protein